MEDKHACPQCELGVRHIEGFAPQSDGSLLCLECGTLWIKQPSTTELLDLLAQNCGAMRVNLQFTDGKAGSMTYEFAIEGIKTTQGYSNRKALLEAGWIDHSAVESNE